MYTIAVLGFLALFLLATPLDADPAFREAQSFYAQLDYEQAILRFEQVAVRPDLEKPDKARALLWLGLSYAGVADFDSARRYLKGAIDTDENVALPDKVSPRVSKMFADLKAAHASERASSPDGSSTPPSSPPKPAPHPMNGAVLVGAGVSAAGAIAIVSAVATGSLAAYHWGQATAPHQFQDTAKAELDATNSYVLDTAILAPVGVAVAAVGVALIAFNVE